MVVHGWPCCWTICGLRHLLCLRSLSGQAFCCHTVVGCVVPHQQERGVELLNHIVQTAGTEAAHLFQPLPLHQHRLLSHPGVVQHGRQLDSKYPEHGDSLKIVQSCTFPGIRTQAGLSHETSDASTIGFPCYQERILGLPHLVDVYEELVFSPENGCCFAPDLLAGVE